MSENRAIFHKLAYLLYVSFQRVIKNKNFFLLMLLSVTAAITVPSVGISLAEALIKQKNAVYERYPDTAYAYRSRMAAADDMTMEYIRENICYAGVLASIYFDYVIFHPDSAKQSGRFIDVNAADAEAFSILYSDAPEQVRDSFTGDRFVCAADYQTAKKCRLRVGDKISVRGDEYELIYITAGQSGNSIFIPYSKIASAVPIQHTIYLMYDSYIPKESVTDSMRSLFPGADGENAVPLKEVYETKRDEAYSTVTAAALVTILYLICAGVNISMIRYGYMRIKRHDYAVSLALGSTKKELLLGFFFENLILTPPAVMIGAGLFYIITKLIPFPYYMSISPFTAASVFILAILTSCSAAFAAAVRMPAQSCVSMLKDM